MTEHRIRYCLETDVNLIDCCKMIFNLQPLSNRSSIIRIEGEEMQPDIQQKVTSIEDVVEFGKSGSLSSCTFYVKSDGIDVLISVEFGLHVIYVMFNKNTAIRNKWLKTIF